jgi:cell pole-organizing protein PopZ
MEEILASIRKIISEDSTEPQPAAPAAAAPAPVQAEADVLELTQEIEEIPQPAPQPAPVPPPQPVQAAAPAPAPEPVRPAPQDDVVFQAIDEPVVVPTPAPAAAPAPAPSMEGFVSAKASSAIDDALSAIDFGAPEPHSTAPVAPVSGLSVESVFDQAIRETFEPVLRAWLQEQASVIVDRMKPAIREWMDDNLPDMLKTAVEAEVARAVKARTTRR